ncbi:hypothetical protein A6P54_19030 [Bacillus sp. MKU004]|nr:hypothetical protein A6P54_19030 [Bacillus sp. MKU004]
MTCKRKLLFIFSFISAILMQTACSDIKETQDINYATAIGVDYKEGKYHCYIQLVDLTKVAKTEGSNPEPAKMWVSEATGDIFIDAFFEIYQTAQERFIWGHVTAIVLSEAAIEKGFQEIYDGLTRYHEFRLTPWVYGTSEPIKDILSTPGFFGQTSLNTVLHNPVSTFTQSSQLKPIQFFQFARQVYEPAYTSYLPSLAINRTQWEQNEEKEPKLFMNGAYFIKNDDYKGFYPLAELMGLRWLIPDMERVPLLIPIEKEATLLTVFTDPKATFKVTDSTIEVMIEAKGIVANRDNHGVTNLNKMEKLAEKSIKEEVQGVFQLGIKENTDFLNLEHTLFREEGLDWRKNQRLSELTLNLEVNVEFIHSGALENKIIDIKKLR